MKSMRQWLALVMGCALITTWVLALLTHTVHDAAWSTSGLLPQAGDAFTHFLHRANWLGALGAYAADISLYACGYSVFWLPLLSVWTYLRLRKGLNAPSLGYGALLVLASSTLEWLIGQRWDVRLPFGAGGLLGHYAGTGWVSLLQWSLPTQGWVSVLGSLITLLLALMALAGAFSFSWHQCALRLGHGLQAWLQARSKQQEMDQDISLGQQAAREREVQNLRDKVQAPHSKEESSTPQMAELSTQQARESFPVFDLDDGLALTQTKLVAKDGPAPPSTLQVVPAKASTTSPLQSRRVAQERQHTLFVDENRKNLPMVDLLDVSAQHQESVTTETLEMTSRLIERKLKDFGVQVRVVAAMPGPVITRYEIEPATGVKGSQVVNLAKDLARSLSLVSIRVIETIPGKNIMALELPNAKRQTIKLSEILGSDEYNNAKSVLTLGLGKDIVGKPVVVDLAKMPHCLVAGTTGSGKSVGINAMILSLLYKAEAHDVRLLLIDPKMLEMSVYEGIPHLIAPVVTDMRQAAHGLNWCVAEMEKRYKLMSKMGVRNLASYNQKIVDAKQRGELIPNPFSLNPEQPEPLEKLPYIVVVIDELADLMMVVGKKIEELIARLAQKARASGVHLVLATQRPSVDVITGLIKANIPTRMAFQVSSKIDSRTILDQMGAEALLGMGDMLYLPSGTGFPTRVHGAFVSDEEVHRVVEHLKIQNPNLAEGNNYIEGVLEGASGEDGFGLDGAGEPGNNSEKDALYDQAVEIVLKNRKASISLVQRHLKIGYNRAARMLESMEQAGLISALSSNGQRDILVPNQT